MAYFYALRRMAEIISNSAILPPTRPQRRVGGGTRPWPGARKMADFPGKSAIN